jgi:hypothetical protein
MNSTAPNNREKEIFEQALDLATGAERLAFVNGACGGDATLCARVLALLQAHETDKEFLPEEPKDLATVLLPITEKPGDKIGRYRLMEKITEGGCGIVYVAEQEEPVRRGSPSKSSSWAWTPAKSWPGSRPSGRRWR